MGKDIVKIFFFGLAVNSRNEFEPRAKEHSEVVTPAVYIYIGPIESLISILYVNENCLDNVPIVPFLHLPYETC